MLLDVFKGCLFHYSDDDDGDDDDDDENKNSIVSFMHENLIHLPEHIYTHTRIF